MKYWVTKKYCSRVCVLKIKGWKHSEETKKRMSESRLKKPHNRFWLGKKRILSEKHIQNIRETNALRKGIKRPPFSEEWRKNLSISHMGILVGEKNPKWISDRTKLIKRQERNDSTYCSWRQSVWLRDNFKCKIANPDCKGRIEAHHILGWKDYPELRYEINNGITLCHAHHPLKRAEEKRLSPYFQELVSASK